jgi:BlaI family transcriptional regulator, penicillinase repressor
MNETSNPSFFAAESVDPATPRKISPRRAVLDLAPLELDCMNTLWPLGEGTVRQIRDRLAARRPRAYTTIMTIMDRLARKGVVERRKSGRAYTYRPNLSAQEARSQALAQVIENFFAGSKEELLAHLSGSPAVPADGTARGAAVAPLEAPPRARAAAASASSAVPRLAAPESAHTAPESDAAEPIDDTLL